MAGRGQKAKTRNPAGFLSVLYKCAVYALTSPHRKAADGFHLPSSQRQMKKQIISALSAPLR